MHFIHSLPESPRAADSRETTLNDSRTSGTRGKPEEHRAARAPQSSSPASSRPPPQGGTRVGSYGGVSGVSRPPRRRSRAEPLQSQCASTNGTVQGKPGSAAPRARTAFAVPPRCPRQSHFLFQFLYPGSRRRYPRREHAAALPDKPTPANPETFAAPSRFAKRRGCHIRGAHTCAPRDRVCPLPSLSPPGAGSPHLPAGRWAGSRLQPTWPPVSSARPAAPGSSGTSPRPPPAPAAALRSRRRRTPLLRAAGGGRSAPPRGRRRRRRTEIFSEGRAPAPRSPPPPAERAKRASAPSIAESSAPLPPTSATRPAGGKINK